MVIDELHFAWDRQAAAHRNRSDSVASRPPSFDEYIEFLEQFDRRGEVDTADYHVDKQFVLPAEPGDR